MHILDVLFYNILHLVFIIRFLPVLIYIEAPRNFQVAHFYILCSSCTYLQEMLQYEKFYIKHITNLIFRLSEILNLIRYSEFFILKEVKYFSEVSILFWRFTTNCFDRLFEWILSSWITHVWIYIVRRASYCQSDFQDEWSDFADLVYYVYLISVCCQKLA